MKRVYVLFGGLAGVDGSLFSRGMADLADQIKRLPGVYCTTHYWTSWKSVLNSILKQAAGTKVVLVGYSGGGSRLTWVARATHHQIPLVVGYDPSPIVSVGAFQGNVPTALCYTNKYANAFGLGGGHYRGIHCDVDTTEFVPPKPHLAVQYDQDLHRKTLNAIAGL